MTHLTRLIDSNHNIIETPGKAIEGAGIFDLDDNEYIAGYDKDGVLFADWVDSDDTVLDFDGNRTKYKI